MTWSPAKVVTALALAAWAGLFWLLLASGRSALYLSSRTDWVVPMGAVVLTIAALGRLLTARGDRREEVTPRQAWGVGLIVLPVVAVLALPPAALGSFAASRRSAVGGSFASAPEELGEEVSLGEVAAGVWSDEARKALFDRAGSPVDFVGIVTRREGLPADEFYLTRFIVSCCVADALSVQVRVVGAPADLEQDQWVRVRGTLYPLKEDVVVAASGVERVERPDRPYLDL